MHWHRFVVVCLLVAAAAAAAGPPAAPAATPVPSPARPAPEPSPKVDKPSGFDTGFDYALAVADEYGLVDELEASERVNRIGRRIALASAGEDLACSFRVVKMEERNAFALPGGFVFVTEGMLRVDLTDDELAHLLAHELAHVVRKHHAKLARRAAWASLLEQLLVVGLILGMPEDSSSRRSLADEIGRSQQGLEGKGAVVMGTLAFGDVFRILMQQGFSREMEEEADTLATEWAWKAGFDPTAGRGLMNKLHARIYEAPGMDYWRSHPFFEERVIGAEARARAYAGRPLPEADPGAATALQLRLKGLHDQVKDERRRDFLLQSAYWADPAGPAAGAIVLDLERPRWRAEQKRPAFLRDYQGMLERLKLAAEKLGQARPEEPALAPIEELRREVAAEQVKVEPQYIEGLDGNFLGTAALERFLANFPASPRRGEALLRLAEHERLAEKEWEAVGHYLDAIAADPAGEWAGTAGRRLGQMVPHLEDPGAAFRIAGEGPAEAAGAAAARLPAVAAAFEEAEAGKRFLTRWPEAEAAAAVRTRLDDLARQAYNRGRQYEAIGQPQKALDQYNEVVETAPSAEVAELAAERIEALKKGAAAGTGEPAGT